MRLVFTNETLHWILTIPSRILEGVLSWYRIFPEGVSDSRFRYLRKPIISLPGRNAL